MRNFSPPNKNNIKGERDVSRSSIFNIILSYFFRFVKKSLNLTNLNFFSIIILIKNKLKFRRNKNMIFLILFVVAVLLVCAYILKPQPKKIAIAQFDERDFDP